MKKAPDKSLLETRDGAPSSTSRLTRMKQFIKIVLVIANIDFVFIWISIGLLVVSLPDLSLWQILRLVRLSPPSRWENQLVLLLRVSSSPIAWLLTSMKGPFVLVIFSILNSFIWGVCAGVPFYAFQQKYRRRAA